MTIRFAHLDELMRIVPDPEVGSDDCACEHDCGCETESGQIEAADRELAETIWIERGSVWEPVTLLPRALLRRGDHADAGR